MAEEPSEQEHPLTAEERKLLDKLLIPIDSLDLSKRAKNCLKNAEVTHLGNLVGKTEGEMLKFRNFGNKSLQEIKATLDTMGLELGTELSDEIQRVFQHKIQEEKDEEDDDEEKDEEKEEKDEKDEAENQED